MSDDLADLPLRRTPAKPEKEGERNLRLFEESEGQTARGRVPSDAATSAPAHRIDEPEQIPLSAGVAELKETPLNPAAGTKSPLLLLAGLVDVTAHLAVLAIVLLSMVSLGLQPRPNQWPGFAAFLVLFSFLYTTVPLAFWGRSPGMAWWGLRARDADGRPLTFRQTTVRWLSSLFTVLLLGVPLLIIFSGRSLGDWISGSITERVSSSSSSRNSSSSSGV